MDLHTRAWHQRVEVWMAKIERFMADNYPDHWKAAEAPPEDDKGSEPA